MRVGGSYETQSTLCGAPPVGGESGPHIDPEGRAREADPARLRRVVEEAKRHDRGLGGDVLLPHGDEGGRRGIREHRALDPRCHDIGKGLAAVPRRDRAPLPDECPVRGHLLGQHVVVTGVDDAVPGPDHHPLVPERIVVTPGASGALGLVMQSLVAPGQEVLLTDPGYPCNRHFVRLAEGRAVNRRIEIHIRRE